MAVAYEHRRRADRIQPNAAEPIARRDGLDRWHAFITRRGKRFFAPTGLFFITDPARPTSVACPLVSGFFLGVVMYLFIYAVIWLVFFAVPLLAAGAVLAVILLFFGFATALGGVVERYFLTCYRDF